VAQYMDSVVSLIKNSSSKERGSWSVLTYRKDLWYVVERVC